MAAIPTRAECCRSEACVRRVREETPTWKAQLAVTPIWSPVAAFDVDAELMFADRKLRSGLDGDMTRLILFAKDGF
ncbi:hypothetical protein D3C77_374350 [compost metagenome]